MKVEMILELNEQPKRLKKNLKEKNKNKKKKKKNNNNKFSKTDRS